MPFIAPLFLALAEYFTSRRSPKVIADEWKIPIQDFLLGFKKVEHHFWRGRLATALENHTHHPQLIPLLTELAQFEDQYSNLMYQYQRAEMVAAEAGKLGSDQFNLKLKINSLCFRIHQAASRVIRDMQKARIAFEKAENPEPHPAPSARTKATNATPQANNQSNTGSAPPPNVSREGLTTERPEAPEPQASTRSTVEPPVKKKYEPEPVDPVAQACLERHRQRIKNTPPKDRPALIEKLIAAERANQTPAAA